MQIKAGIMTPFFRPGGLPLMTAGRVTAMLLWISLLSMTASNLHGTRLEGPYIVKLDWNTRALLAEDINRDGLTDLALLNRDTAKIEVLLQTGDSKGPLRDKRQVLRNRWEPVLHDAPFLYQGIGSGILGLDLASGDFNGDGHPDFAYTAANEGVTVLLQDDKGNFRESRRFDRFEPRAQTETLIAQDLNGDGADELIVLGTDAILLFKGGVPLFAVEPLRYPVAETNPFNLHLNDLNGDDRPDLVYQAAMPDQAMVIRLQNARELAFGPAIPMHYKDHGMVAIPMDEDEAGAAYVWVESQSRLIESFLVRAEPAQEQDWEERLQPAVYAATEGSGQGARYARGDYNGDGLEDLVVADPEAARIRLLLRGKNGILGQGKDFPAFSGISAMTSVKLHGEAEELLFMVSEAEKIVGYTRYEGGQVAFPQLLRMEGTPLAIATLQNEEDSLMAVLLVDDGKRRISFFSPPSGESEPFSSSISLSDMRRDPRALFPVDLDADGKEELLVPVPREPARLFRQGEEGSFEEIGQEAALRKGILHDLDPDRLGRGDSDGDGYAELLVAGNGFVRAIRLNQEGNLEVVRQYNSRRHGAELAAPVLFFPSGKTESPLPSLAVFHPRDNLMEVIGPDGEGGYQSLAMAATTPLDCEKSAFLPLLGDSRLGFYGKHRFWEIALEGEVWIREPFRQPYETDLQEVRYSMALPGSFSEDNRTDLIAIDGAKNVLELLIAQTDGSYRSLLHFTLFEKNLHYGGRRGAPHEPREVLLADLTDDDLQDIAMLIHDRVLIFPQKR